MKLTEENGDSVIEIKINFGENTGKEIAAGVWPNDTLAVIFDGAGAGYELFVTATGKCVLYELSGTAEQYCTVGELYSSFKEKNGEEISATTIAEYMLRLIGEE